MLSDGGGADGRLAGDTEDAGDGGAGREDELAMLLSRAPRELLAFVRCRCWRD